MPGGLQEILPLLLQIDQSKRQERAQVVQEEQLGLMKQQQQAALMGEFAKSLETVRDPQQLNAYKDFFEKNFGIDRKAIDDFTANYLPTLSAQRAGASYSGVQAMQPSARGLFNQTAAYSNVTGQTEGGAAISRNIASDPNKIESASSIEAGTDVSELNRRQMVQNLMQMTLQRDIAQSGQQIDIRGQNLQNLISSRNYALGLLPYEMAKAGAGKDGGFSKPEDQMKYLLDLIQEQNKGGSKLTQRLLDALIRKNANPLFPGQVPQSGTYAPGLWDRLSR